MDKTSRGWLRPILVLGVLGAFAAAMLISPASAHLGSFAHLKSHIRKIAKKVAKKQATTVVQNFGPTIFELTRPDEPFSFLITGDGEQTIVAAGGLSVVAVCDINTTPTTDDASLEIRTTVNNAAFDDNNGPEDTDFDIADSPEELFSTSVDDNPEIEVTGSGSGVTGVASDGSVVAVNDYALGLNLANQPGTCFFSGVATSDNV